MGFKRTFSRIIRGICYLPRTLYINFRTLPFGDAVKFPYIVMGPCAFEGIQRKNIRIDAPIKRGMIRLAAQKTAKRGIPVNRKAHLIIDNKGSITFRGNASIGAGTSICASGGHITLGENFSCNVNCFLYSMDFISIGNDVLLGWDIHIRDNDGHPLYHQGVRSNPDQGIRLNDRIWVASYTDILKGVSLAQGTIIGTRSLVTKSFEEENILIAGVPARKIKEQMTWEHRAADN